MAGIDNKHLEWWREARFGMFIHWGLYAVPAGEWQGKRIPGIGEWIMYRGQIPIAEYEQLTAQFNPVKFDAEAWVKVAHEAGMKYLVITSKHHDGFAMFKSAHPYNIVDATSFKRDPMKELADACHQYGVRLCFYHSQDLDWNDPGGSMHWEEIDHPLDPAVKKALFAKYLEEKVKPQLRELLTNYGPIGLIWFDVPAAVTREQSHELRELVHSLQPECLVSGRVGHDAGDFGSLGDNQIPAGRVQGDWETPATLNDTWGFKHYDHNWKSVEYLVRLMVQCASKGVNYLLNVGPTAEGLIPQPSIERLQAVGRWLKVNGESIYGTQQSPFPCDFPWGRVTCKPGRIYLHFFGWPGPDFALAGLRSRVRGVRLLADGRQLVPFRQEHDAASDHHLLRLSLPETAPDPHLSVIALDLAGEIEVDPLPVQQPDGGLVLPAYLARLEGPPQMQLERAGSITGWNTAGAQLRWTYRLREPGRYRVLVQTFMDRERSESFAPREGLQYFYGNHRLRLSVDGQALAGLVGRKDLIMDESVNRWHTAESDLGAIDFASAGAKELTLAMEEPDQTAELGATVCGVRLVPVGVG
ncbi:MAG: alpha-L-fucosidase [Candidatus Latescibacteria bacterium]|nr:alpha-L-fucosidase [Candidatus Latescibacterota bacterium]